MSSLGTSLPKKHELAAWRAASKTRGEAALADPGAIALVPHSPRASSTVVRPPAAAPKRKKAPLVLCIRVKNKTCRRVLGIA
jgi:hypothetical protein